LSARVAAHVAHAGVATGQDVQHLDVRSSTSMKKEQLPRGFWRAPNGSIRVLIRVKGWRPAVRTFKLVCDTPAERKRQFAEAEQWAVSTRLKLYAGQGVSSIEARDMTLADALQRYRRDGLSSRPENRRKDERRIDRILRDPIAERRIMWDCQKSCVRGRVDHHALTNLSSNMMANCVFASHHSRGGIFHSPATWRKTR